MPSGIRATWLLLIHRIPSKPDYLRVRIGRRLRQAGAVAIKNSVYVAPVGPATRATLTGVAHDILERGGDAVVCEAEFVDGLADGAVEDLLRSACVSEYAAIAAEAKGLASELRRARPAGEARVRQVARRIDRMRNRLDEIAAKDHFGAPGREAAAGLLSLAEDRNHGIERAGRGPAAPLEPPRAATWVTRTGVMVDRMASAWLIRRFIDPEARFKFVTARGYRPAGREVRFDMAGAEFTHELDRLHVRSSGRSVPAPRFGPQADRRDRS